MPVFWTYYALKTPTIANVSLYKSTHILHMFPIKLSYVFIFRP